MDLLVHLRAAGGAHNIVLCPSTRVCRHVYRMCFSRQDVCVCAIANAISVGYELSVVVVYTYGRRMPRLNA